VASLTGTILAMLKNSVLQIFADHKLDLLGNDYAYIIPSV
jgi:hypothetical protein